MDKDMLEVTGFTKMTATIPTTSPRDWYGGYIDQYVRAYLSNESIYFGWRNASWEDRLQRNIEYAKLGNRWLRFKRRQRVRFTTSNLRLALARRIAGDQWPDEDYD